jgi:hypothetical protein
MEESLAELNISLSPSTYEILKETKKGTNLTNSDVIEMIIRQYFKPDQSKTKQT